MKKTEVPHLKISDSGKNEDNDSFDLQFFNHTWIPLINNFLITVGYCQAVFRLDVVG